LLKGNKYILSAENTEIDADSYKIDILESSVSSPFVEEVSNSAGDSPHLDAPLWISCEFPQPLSNSQILKNVFQYDPHQWTSEPFILET